LDKYVTNKNIKMQNVVNSNTFEKWFERSVFNDTCCLPEKESREIAELFDHFMLSPNDLYYDEATQKEHPIGSKSRLFSSIEEIKTQIPAYRFQYYKLILYSIQSLTRTDTIKLKTGPESTTSHFYKVRFAGFPEKWHK
jgi:hypothetical protein